MNLPPLNARIRARCVMSPKATNAVLALQLPPVYPGDEGRVFAAMLTQPPGPEAVIVVDFDYLKGTVTWETIAAFYEDCEVL